MKTGEDFRKEFPEADESFRDAACQALDALHTPRKTISLRCKPIIAVALVLIVIVGTAVAGTVGKWSMFSNVPDFMQTASKDEQAQMKSSFQPVFVAGQYADMTIREAVYDGFGLYMAIDMTPHNQQVFLIPDLNVSLDEPAAECCEGFPADVTLAEHIEALGYTTIYRVDFSTDLVGMVFPATMAYNEDGSFTFYLRQRLGTAKDLQQPSLTPHLFAIVKRSGGNRVTNLDLELTIPAQPVLEVKRSAEGFSHVFEKSGVKLTNITLQRTPLTTYLTADVEVVDEEVFANRGFDYFFSATDQAGTRLNTGYFNVSGMMTNHETGAYEYTCTLSLNKLPDVLYLSEFEWGRGEGNLLLNTIAIPMQ